MKPFRLLLAAVLLAASVTAVSAQQVTVRLRQVKLVQVLDEISRQTGYAFYHSRPTVDPDRIVSLDVADTKLETALDRLFAGTQIGYEIKNRKIYLTAKPAASTPPPSTSDRKGYGDGCVRRARHRGHGRREGYDTGCQYGHRRRIRS